MHRKLFLFPIVFALILFVMISSGGTTSIVAQGQSAPIRLKAATFTPAAGETISIPPGLSIAGYAYSQRGYYIVQFVGPVQQSWKDSVEAAGAELIEYIPDFAFKVRMNPAQASQVESLGTVAWVGLFQPAYKLSPDLIQDGTSLYRVRIERGANARQVIAAVAQSGVRILRDQDSLLILADATQLVAIANVLDVSWIENFVLPVKHNDTGAGVIMGANTANTNGYDGSTQIVAVADTGIGGGTASTAHPDIPVGRVTAVFDWAASSVGGCYTAINDGAIDVDSGHGTHVAVSVLGDGDAGGIGKGTAPAASLVFQAVEDFADMKGQCAFFNPDGYYLLGLPDDLHALYQQAYDAGARIHSNSWGSSQAGVYTLDSANTDDFIWDNPDMTITFSAGNDGVDNNGDGVIDNDSTGSPATAKNVITVGASENQRSDDYPCDTGLSYTSHDAYQTGQTCSNMGGQNLLGTWGSRYGFVGPMANDPTAGNAEQMAGWSSRGPTDDGRIKPDVVAPGTWILSGYSERYQEGYGDPLNPQNGIYQWDGWGMPYSQEYKYMGGTSMSNPLAAGAAAVVRDYYQKAHTHSASAALVKATMINSAVDLLDENNDGINDNDFPIPNIHEGWGRVNVANAIDNSHDFDDHTTGINTSGTVSYDVNVTAGGSPLKISLVWSDFPSTETASINLVNDLDLVVTDPGGNSTYLGNVFNGGWSQTGGSADRLNNVENIYIQSASAGTWNIDVVGFNVPQGSQPFAIVVDGGSLIIPPPPSSMHVGDLDSSTATGRGGKWNATITITVHDESHSPVANATVSGSWSAGASGSGSCITSGSGQCSITKNNIHKNSSSATFTVNNVTGSFIYNASDNHDPDMDSNGTSIVVLKP